MAIIHARRKLSKRSKYINSRIFIHYFICSFVILRLQILLSGRIRWENRDLTDDCYIFFGTVPQLDKTRQQEYAVKNYNDFCVTLVRKK